MFGFRNSLLGRVKRVLLPLLGMEVEELEAGKISYNWQATSNHYNSFVDDIVLILIYNETTDMFLIFDEAVRNDASFIVEIPKLYAGNVLHSWAFAMKRNRKVTSNSQYLGKLIVS